MIMPTACEIVDLPQSSYSASSAHGSCPLGLIQLDSWGSWCAAVMLHIDLFTNGMLFSCVAHKYVFVCVHRSFAGWCIIQWLRNSRPRRDIFILRRYHSGSRWNNSHYWLQQTRTLHSFPRDFALIAHHHPCFPVRLDYGNDTSLQVIPISGLLIMKSWPLSMVQHTLPR